ncbi:MAG: hypothetical protein KA324_10110, partial [Rubrivivax sp.]|nr:hypothetical protein [Rubrivivax sp.]
EILAQGGPPAVLAVERAYGCQAFAADAPRRQAPGCRPGCRLIGRCAARDLGTAPAERQQGRHEDPQVNGTHVDRV